jgi:phosphate starvation-inducible PhoH-like protein
VARRSASRQVLAFAVDAGNSELANVTGALDANLRQIETELEVSISRRGHQFRVEGPQPRAQQAVDVLQHFLARAKRPVSIDDIQLYIVERRGGAVAEAAAPDAEALPALHTRRRELHGRTPRQRDYLASILEHDISFGIGPAGTGKTYLAVACAVDPYLRPLYDALFDLAGFDKTQRLLERQTIEIAPLAYMRGRTLNQAFVILDEAQNTSPEQMKMFLTRIGFGSKAVITGDVTQIDLPRGTPSGLIEAQHVLRGVRGLGFTYFTAADVVRHPLVARIVEAYEAATERADAGAPAGTAPRPRRG